MVPSTKTCYSSVSKNDRNGNVFPGNVTVPCQGMTETDTCFRETCFRFHQSLVNSEKMIPPNWGGQICPRAKKYKSLSKGSESQPKKTHVEKNTSGNRKDLKCAVVAVCRPCQLIPMYAHYYVNTVQYYFTR